MAMRIWTLVAGLLALVSGSPTPASADSQIPATEVQHFIGCPVYRDTDAGRKSGCWLVTNPADGRQYDVTDARLKPILGQQILVEGIATTTDSAACGAPILKPVDVSVLPGQCKGYLIPAEGHPGRRFALPARVLQPTSVPRTLPVGPYGPREFSVHFELNSDFFVYQYAELIIEDAMLYARASKPRRILITGYAATRGSEISGQLVREDAGIAMARAQMAAEALARYGIPRDLMQLQGSEDPPALPDSEEVLPEASRRRVTIRIEP